MLQIGGTWQAAARTNICRWGVEGVEEGGRVMRCWQISSSGGAAQGMFLINFLDVIIVILSLSIPTSDDAAMRFCYAARNA